MDFNGFRRSKNVEDFRGQVGQSPSDPLSYFSGGLSLATLGNEMKPTVPQNDAAAFGLDLSQIGAPYQVPAPYAAQAPTPYQDYLDQRLRQTQMPAWLNGRGF